MWHQLYNVFVQTFATCAASGTVRIASGIVSTPFFDDVTAQHTGQLVRRGLGAALAVSDSSNSHPAHAGQFHQPITVDVLPGHLRNHGYTVDAY